MSQLRKRSGVVPLPTQLIDTRPSAYFNGWPEPRQKSGGHLPGAVNLSAHWLEILSDAELQVLLAEKGLSAERPVTLYGQPAQVQQVAAYLYTLGWSQIAQLGNWQASGHALERLPRFQQLVPVEWLAFQLQTKQRPTVVEVAWGAPKQYLAAHIPGAVYLDTNLLEQEPLWNRVDGQRLEQVLLELGIRHDTQVVLYGRDTTAAARAAQLMLYAGVRDVRLLDGGWQAWEVAGLAKEIGVSRPKAVSTFGVEVPGNPQWVIDLPQAKGYLGLPAAELVSVRSWAEFTGQTSGYSYIDAIGRIDGAVWGRAGSDPYHMEDYRNPDNTMRSATELAQMWREAGITADKQLAFFCGTGWRASEAFFYAYLMGWQQISVFDGGWYEWSQSRDNPAALGEAAGEVHSIQ